MTFEVTILGNGSATPTLRHNPTAQVVNLHDKLFLIDCGEGTQLQMRKFEIRFQKINHVFISHLHGDHYLGLLGYISTMHLLGRKRELHIYGPPDLKTLVEMNLKFSESYLDYQLVFHDLQFKEKELLFEDKTIEVYSFPLKHRISCCGFLFQEKKRPEKIRSEIVQQYKLQPSQILKLKKGENVELPGSGILKSEMAFEPAPASRKYAYCSDTMYWETILQHIQGANLLYHESTFLEADRDRAKTTFHSTSAQAAKIAKMADVKHLLLGHYSSRYKSLDLFVEEAREVFVDSTLSVEGVTYQVQ